MFVSFGHDEEKIKLKEKFKLIMNKNFGAQTEKSNFGDPKTRKEMNGYVDEFTDQKSKDLLSEGNA